MDMNELRLQRIRNVKDAVRMERCPDRVPHLSSYYTWKIFDSDKNYKLSDAIYNWDVMEEVVMENQKRYQFDIVRDSGVRNPYKIIQGFAEPRYYVDDVREVINVKDMEFMRDDEYGQITSDYVRYLWEVLIPRRYPQMKTATKEEFATVIEGYKEFMQYSKRINQRLRDECGLPTISAMGSSSSCFDQVFSLLRGYVGTSLDMRRHTKELDELVQTLNQRNIYPTLERLAQTKGTNMEFAFDYMAGFQGYTVLNKKQWERFYWPSVKAAIDTIVANDKVAFFCVQGSLKKFYEYFADVPKGHLAIQLEQDDIFEARKLLPNVCLVGGLNHTILSEGTPEQCVDFTKRLVDEVGANGGFILSQEKMGSYRGDTKRENLLAICEFIQNYK